MVENISRLKISENFNFNENKLISSHSNIFNKNINRSINNNNNNNNNNNDNPINVNKNIMKINDNLSHCRSLSSDNCSSLTSLKSGQIEKNSKFPISTFFDPKRIIIKPGQRIKVRAKGKRK